MPRIAYVNGRYVAHAEASVHIEDRGYQFADGVYEVCEVARGYIVDMKRHLDRLDRSYLHPGAPPVNPAHVHSALPLIGEGY